MEPIGFLYAGFKGREMIAGFRQDPSNTSTSRLGGQQFSKLPKHLKNHSQNNKISY